MSEQIQLRKCPFCGNQPYIDSASANGDDDQDFAWATCTHCNLVLETMAEKESGCAARWNNQTEVIRLELDIVGLKAEKRALELQMHDLKDKLSKFESINYPKDRVLP